MVAYRFSYPKLQRGMRLGKYRLVSHIARGGSSDVWKARDTVERTWVALKLPPPHARGSDEEEEFLEEIRLGASLDHPNILRVRNADHIGGRYVIASDLAEESLEERMRRRLGTHRALSYCRQILEGLSFSHERRVIHRDLKPSNMMLFPGGHLRLADFGLARVVKESMISATGSGTLLYLAPEQAHGYPCFASDVFSVGLVSYEMLTGVLPRWPFEWPFEGLDVLQSKVPGDVVRFIRRAIRRDYRSRFRNALDMLASFDRLQPVIKRFLAGDKPRRRQAKLGTWREVRCREFRRAFGRLLFLRFACPDCNGPVSEHMTSCPWCPVDGLHYGETSEFPCYCSRCERGIRDEWRYCPWCWGPGFEGADGQVRPDPRYRGSCRTCRNPVIEGMRYCPWCHARCTRPARIAALPDRCRSCHGSVARDFWERCPWCTRSLGAGSMARGRSARNPAK